MALPESSRLERARGKEYNIPCVEYAEPAFRRAGRPEGPVTSFGKETEKYGAKADSVDYCSLLQ